MSFKTASVIMRGKWLLDKSWAAAHMPILISVLKGNANLSSITGADESEKNKSHEAVKVLSHKAGSVYSVGYYTDLSRLPSGSIAMVDITGPVTKYGDMCAWGSVDHVATLNRLANAPNIKGIILNIDSPGGEASGTAMLSDAVKSAGKVKPVIAMIDDGIAASAAMWIASAANEIYTTQKTDMVGSIGVYTTIADWYSYFAKEGLNVRDIYAPQSTDKNLDYREALQGNDAPLQEELKVLAQEFINTVRSNRAGKIQGNEWATGKMFYSLQAQKIGLTDGQKSFEQIVRRMDTLIKIKEQSNNNTMAFEKTLTAAQSQSFEVVDGGFLVQESELNNIEAALADGEIRLADQSLQAQQAVAAQKTAEDNLQTAQDTINAHETTIQQQSEEIARLKSGPAGSMKDTSKDTDDVGNEKQIDPVTAEAKKLREMRDGK